MPNDDLSDVIEDVEVGKYDEAIALGQRFVRFGEAKRRAPFAERQQPGARWQLYFADRIAPRRRLGRHRELDDLQMWCHIRDCPNITPENGVFRSDGTEAFGVYHLVNLVGIFSINLLAIILIDATHRSAAVVFRDQTDGEIDVEITRERPAGIGLLDPRGEQRGLMGTITLDYLETLGTGLISVIWIDLDDDNLVALFTQYAGRSEPDATGPDDHEPH